MKIAVTGHRPDKLGGEYDMDGVISNYLLNRFDTIIKERKPDKIISGMALGVDTLWSISGLSLGVSLIAAIPCKGQESRWAKESQEIYWQILKHPLTEVHYCSTDDYYPALLQRRNEWMVNNCDLLVAVWNGTKGGTKNCIDYANKRKREILMINPYQIN